MCKRQRYDFYEEFTVERYSTKCTCEINKAHVTKPLCLWIDRSMLQYFCHVARMPQKRFVRHVLLAALEGKHFKRKP